MALTAQELIDLARAINLPTEQMEQLIQVAKKMSEADREALQNVFLEVKAKQGEAKKKRLQSYKELAGMYDAYNKTKARKNREQTESVDHKKDLAEAEALLNEL